MRILSMTATFGKLEGETLRFHRGMNVITAPNEWGKSTWCAFIMAMLYGINTRQRSKQGTIADKERYKPWSGRPMEGSMELEWEGRSITIERRTKGRIPMGEFRAFETDSGLEVSELTGENCGQMLLGVERSVYLRSGFLSGGDLPVDQDEALSRRLNRLVTTGDDSPAMMGLETRLRELRNQCQYHSKGLLPQTRQALAQVQEELELHRSLQSQCQTLEGELEGLEAAQKALNSHEAFLRAGQNKEKLERLEWSRQEEQEAIKNLKQRQDRCSGLPSPENIREDLQAFDRLEAQIHRLDQDMAQEASATEQEAVPAAFRGLTGQEALAMARQDVSEAERPEDPWWVWVIPGLALAGTLFLPKLAKLLAVVPILGACVLLWRRKKRAKDRAWAQSRLEERYGTGDARQILRLAQTYGDKQEAQKLREEQQRARARVFSARREALLQQQRAIAPGREPLLESLRQWEALDQVQKTAAAAQQYRQAMEAMARGMEEAPPVKSNLHLNQEQTRQALVEAAQKLEAARSRLDRLRGQQAGLSRQEDLEARQESLQQRVQKLEQWYRALGCAQEYLVMAQGELESRFAPRITAGAGAYLKTLTGGRYQRLLMDREMNLSAAAQKEGTALPAAWRSEGTVDQMYLALRLAVAQVLLPHAPLILDDVFVRFDEGRLSAALELLSREQRQVIVFSCQEREKRWISEKET